MKSALSILLFSSILFACQPSKDSSSATIKMKGSESMHAVFQELKENFEKSNPGIHILLEGGGSRTGLNAIREQSADIGLSSFEFDLEKELGSTSRVKEQLIAYDGVVLITNENNPLDSLTDEQVEKIYEGQINDWSEIGGNPGSILPIVRDENSGTQKFFTEHYAINSLSNSAVTLDENKDIVNKVHSNVNAIGFIGFAYFAHGVHEIKLAADSFKFRSPTKSNLINNTYPLKRGLRIYYNDQLSDSTKAFLVYLNSEEAKSIIESFGLIQTN